MPRGWRLWIVGCAVALISACGGGGGGGNSSSGSGVVPTASDGISFAKGMVQDLVNTNTSVGSNFWNPQSVNVANSLQGASLDASRYGSDLDWLNTVIRQLDSTGGSTLTGYFKTGLWEYNGYSSSEKQWPYTLRKSGTTYTYTLTVGSSSYTGTATGITRRSDGSVSGFSLQAARFPGELVGVSQYISGRYTYTYSLQGSDVLNLTLSNSGGTLETASGTIEGYNLTSSIPRVVTTLTSGTWNETATGGTEGNSHAWQPVNLTVRIVSGSYTFNGTMDFSGYQSNATASASIDGGPSWGWHALNTTGTTFTTVHFIGEAQNGQGATASLDFSVSLLNYTTLRLDQPRSASNAPSIQIASTAKLQVPSQPLLTLVVGSTTNALYAINSTLDYTFGNTHISGTGVYYPSLAGQTSSWLMTASLKNEKNVQFDIKQNLLGKFSGSVSYYNLTIGTVEDVGFGPRVRYTDGTFTSLF